MSRYNYEIINNHEQLESYFKSIGYFGDSLIVKDRLNRVWTVYETDYGDFVASRMCDEDEEAEIGREVVHLNLSYVNNQLVFTEFLPFIVLWKPGELHEI